MAEEMDVHAEEEEMASPRAAEVVVTTNIPEAEEHTWAKAVTSTPLVVVELAMAFVMAVQPEEKYMSEAEPGQEKALDNTVLEVRQLWVAMGCGEALLVRSRA